MTKKSQEIEPVISKTCDSLLHIHPSGTLMCSVISLFTSQVSFLLQKRMNSNLFFKIPTNLNDQEETQKNTLASTPFCFNKNSNLTSKSLNLKRERKKDYYPMSMSFCSAVDDTLSFKSLLEVLGLEAPPCTRSLQGSGQD